MTDEDKTREQLLEEVRTLRTQLERADDRRQWAEKALIGIGLDVTERRRAEEALAESRRRYQAIFENALDAILLMDDAGLFVDANPAAWELLGYGREELVRMYLWDITPVPARE